MNTELIPPTTERVARHTDEEILRRLGIRTQTEIDHERYALKALRGDFKRINGDGNDRPSEALKAARA